MLYVYFGHIYAAFSIGTWILAEFSPLNLFYYKQLHAELRRSVMLYVCCNVGCYSVHRFAEFFLLNLVFNQAHLELIGSAMSCV